MVWRVYRGMKTARQWFANAGVVQQIIAGLALPAADDATLLASLEQWLLPHLEGLSRLDDAPIILPDHFEGTSWAQRQNLDELLPTPFYRTNGSWIPLRYAAGRAQCWQYQYSRRCLVNATPGKWRIKDRVQIELLSPAKRRYRRSLKIGGLRQAYNDVKKTRALPGNIFGPG